MIKTGRGKRRTTNVDENWDYPFDENRHESDAKVKDKSYKEPIDKDEEKGESRIHEIKRNDNNRDEDNRNETDPEESNRGDSDNDRINVNKTVEDRNSAIYDHSTSTDRNKSEDVEKLRDISRKNYLERREGTKLAELSRQVEKLEILLNTRKMTKREAEDYHQKKDLLNLLTENSIEEDSSYFELLDDMIDPEGKIDRKRKHDILHKKDVYDDSEAAKRSKRNRYENQWEEEQVRKANMLGSAAAGDEIVVPGQENYDFIFDDSQFITFAQDKPLEGEISDSESPELLKRLSIEEVRKSLPVYKYKKSFLDSIRDHQVLIVVGETGSGKTTQLPQYLYEAGFTKKEDGSSLKVGCTQPRRVAAISVAHRVAEEMDVEIGREVGYSIRFEDTSSEKTVVQYVTDGMLLREFLTDPDLSSYGALMIDEAHERTVSTEIILSLLKDIIQVRKDLKLVIASATINAEKFSAFFNDAPIFRIPGRRFPVDIHYTKNPESNYIQASLTTILQIHITQELPGDILVFLTGQDEIETMQESLNDACHKLGSLIKPLLVCPVYANLPSEQQRLIFEPTPRDSRKVVLATNIAETSITIDGITYVIDPGYVKENFFNPVTGMESLVVVPCSRASANQRAGRAGRVGPGKCFRLYTKWSYYNEIQANPTPEILRVNLVSVVLLLLSLGINDLINFNFVDPPSPDSLIKALEMLYSLGALNSKGEITRTGRKMAEFPIHPMFSKALLEASKYGVLKEILTVISMLSESSSIFHRPKDKKEQLDKRKDTFRSEYGDHLTLLNVWELWQDSGFSNLWCQDNFIQYKTIKRARDVREQLERLCTRVGILEQVFSGKERDIAIRKALVAGFFPNIARLSKMGDSFRSMKKNQSMYIHPSSVLFLNKPPPKLVLYHELVLTNKEYMRNCLLIDPKWVMDLAPHYYNEKELELLISLTQKQKISR